MQIAANDAQNNEKGTAYLSAIRRNGQDGTLSQATVFQATTRSAEKTFLCNLAKPQDRGGGPHG